MNAFRTLIIAAAMAFVGWQLASFRGLPHRMERVRERGGVLYVNDSKATNATSTAPALAAGLRAAQSSASSRVSTSMMK